MLTSNKTIKIFAQPFLQHYVILPLKLLLCKAFFKAVKAKQRLLSRKTPARVVRGAGSPLGGIATLAVQGEAASCSGQLLLQGLVFALQLKAYLSFQHLLYTYSTICFINTQLNNFIG